MDALRHVISDKYVRAINSVRAIERLAETPNQRLVLVPMESAGGRHRLGARDRAWPA
jgi:hypothetical protein